MVAAKLRHRAQRWFIAIIGNGGVARASHREQSNETYAASLQETSAISVGPILKPSRVLSWQVRKAEVEGLASTVTSLPFNILDLIVFDLKKHTRI